MCLCWARTSGKMLQAKTCLKWLRDKSRSRNCHTIYCIRCHISTRMICRRPSVPALMSGILHAKQLVDLSWELSEEASSQGVFPDGVWWQLVQGSTRVKELVQRTYNDQSSEREGSGGKEEWVRLFSFRAYSALYLYIHEVLTYAV